MLSMASIKKGISSNHLHQTVGATLKAAWFMSHRVRGSVRSGGPLAVGLRSSSATASASA